MPLPAGAGVGTLPDGTLTWIDPKSGQAIDADGNPIPGAGAATPVPAATNTARPLPGPAAAPTTAPATTATPATTTPAAATPATTTPATTTSNTAGAAGATGAGGGNALQAPTVAPDVQPVTPTGPPGPDGKPTYTLDNIIQQNQLEIDQAYQQATQAGSDASSAAQRMRDFEAGKGGPNQDQGVFVTVQGVAQPNPAYTAAVNQFNDLTNQAINAQTRIAAAQSSRANTLATAIQNQQVQPELIDKYKADADNARAQANQAQANADKITQAAPDDRALTVAQTSQATAQAAYSNALAAKEILTAPDQQKVLDAQAQLYTDQGKTAEAQVALIGEQTKLTGAQATLTAGATTTETLARANLDNAQADESKSRIALANAQIAAGLPQAQAAQAAGAGAQAQATAQSTLEAIKQKQLGPAYGLQQQIDAINQIASRVWGPGGSGDPADANQFLSQYVQAQLGGTTISDAAKAAAQQQGINYGTTMSGTNALQAAQAQRANAFASFGGNALGTLQQMNMYAPKGSTGMADAFSGVMNAMAQRIAPQGFGPASIPQAPQLPPFLQAFAAGHAAGTQQANAQNQGAGGGGQAAPTVNINVNGQPSGAAAPVAAPAAAPVPAGGPPTTPLGAFNPQMSTAAMNQLGFQDTPQGRAAMAQVLGGQGQGTTGASTSAQGGAQTPTQTPQQAFDQGLANAPQMPNYLQGLVNPMSMIQTARNAGLLGSNTGGLLTPNLPGSFVQ